MKKSLLLIATAVLAMTACTQDVAEMDGGATASVAKSMLVQLLTRILVHR